MTPKRFHRLRQCLLRRQLDLTVAMENVHKPHNFAAIMRTCDAVGIHRAHAVTDSRDIARHHDTAAGANKWVEVETHRDIKPVIERFQENRMQVLAAHVRPGSIDFRDVDYCRPTALIMGSELEGISETTAAAADRWIHIPMQGMVESFNVSVATALILYEAQRQREKAGLYDKPQITGRTLSDTLFEWAYPRLAGHCRRNGYPYPELDADGHVIGRLPRHNRQSS